MPTDEDLALLHAEEIVGCPGELCVGEPVTTIDRPAGGTYGLGIEEMPPSGVRLQVGAPAPAPRRAVLLVCGDLRCDRPRRIPLVELPPVYGPPGRPVTEGWLLAANPDGRVVLAPRYPETNITVRP
ncbi:hypothetical protein ACTMS0_01635 [Micromonospora sp. H33]|uniref:hypothetical protein n=1 Tax=Micromonospora sp. H33 TaxID=3452215 RepID=UPI003F88D729